MFSTFYIELCLSSKNYLLRNFSTSMRFYLFIYLFLLFIYLFIFCKTDLQTKIEQEHQTLHDSVKLFEALLALGRHRGVAFTVIPRILDYFLSSNYH